MVNSLIGIHAGLGELAVFAFAWVFIEMLNPTETRIKRAKIAAMLGVIFLLLAWIAGGYYYVNIYGPNVKPIIKAGPNPWGHFFFMEVKEHLFMLLPFLGFLTFGIISAKQKELAKEKGNGLRWSVLAISGLIVLIGLVMAGMGYIISSSARAALEVLAK